ncbi:MAG: hypothetical protein ACRCS9_10825 [Hyphomicrobium sp.]
MAMPKMAARLAAGTAGIFSGAAVAAAVLSPASDCTVTQAGIARLELEQMSYAAVAQALGCDGILMDRQDFGGTLIYEHYAWRGEAWPFSRFDGKFYNQQLHATSKIWLSLTFSAKNG